MTDSTSPQPVPSDDTVRARVVMLLAWAEDELDLLSSAFRGCTDEELEAIGQSQGVDRLPLAYHEFMRRMGGGGVGSAIAEIFPGDDVALDSILPSEDWPGARQLASDVLAEHAVAAPVPIDHLVIRTHRNAELDVLSLEGNDPPVFGVRDSSGLGPLHDSFTDWLEARIGRAIKRRFPLRDSHLHDVAPRGDGDGVAFDDEGEDWFAILDEDREAAE
jgi:hypothetical protein